MVFTPTYPQTFNRLAAYRKEAVDLVTPKAEQTAAYTFYDGCIKSAYAELGKLCNQPIIQTSYVHQFADEQTAEIRNTYYSRKYVLPLHTVPITGITFAYRVEPYSDFTSVTTLLYKLDSDWTGYNLFHRCIGESYRLNASVGYTDSTMPDELMLAAVELAQGEILRSIYGDSRLGKSTQGVSSSGGGINTTYSDISSEVIKRIQQYRVRVL